MRFFLTVCFSFPLVVALADDLHFNNVDQSSSPPTYKVVLRDGSYNVASYEEGAVFGIRDHRPPTLQLEPINNKVKDPAIRISKKRLFLCYFSVQRNEPVFSDLADVSKVVFNEGGLSFNTTTVTNAAIVADHKNGDYYNGKSCPRYGTPLAFLDACLAEQRSAFAASTLTEFQKSKTIQAKIDAANAPKTSKWDTVAALVGAMGQAAGQSNGGGFPGPMAMGPTATGPMMIVGQWQGGKTERNPIYGTALNFELSFTFRADGTYTETAFVSGRQVTVSGQYLLIQGGMKNPNDPKSTHTLMLTPGNYNGLEEDVNFLRYASVPSKYSVQEYVRFERYNSGWQMSLNDVAGNGNMTGGFGLHQVQ